MNVASQKQVEAGFGLQVVVCLPLVYLPGKGLGYFQMQIAEALTQTDLNSKDVYYLTQ